MGGLITNKTIVMISEQPFHIGQKVEYFRKSKGLQLGSTRLKNGQICTVIDVRKEDFKNLNGNYWYVEVAEDVNIMHTSTNFSPIETNFQTITYEKVMELESPLIGVN